MSNFLKPYSSVEATVFFFFRFVFLIFKELSQNVDILVKLEYGSCWVENQVTRSLLYNTLFTL